MNISPTGDKKSTVRAVSRAIPGKAIALQFDALSSSPTTSGGQAVAAHSGPVDAQDLSPEIRKLPPSKEGGLDRYSITLQRTSAGFGMEITESGHVVSYSGQRGPAELAGVPLDSRIISVEDTAVSTKADITEVLKALYLRTQHDDTTSATFIFQVETSLNRIMSSIDSKATLGIKASVTGARNRKNSLMLAGQAEIHLAGDRPGMALKTYTEALTLDPNNDEIRKGVKRCVQVHRKNAGESLAHATTGQPRRQNFLVTKGARGFGISCSDDCIVMASTGAASDAGLPQFAHIVSVNGVLVRSNDEFRGCLIGVDSVDLEVEMPQSVQLDNGPAGLGLTCDSNAIVQAVAGPAQANGIAVHSRVVAINHYAVDSNCEIIDKIGSGGSVVVTLLPAIEQRAPPSIGEEEEQKGERLIGHQRGF